MLRLGAWIMLLLCVVTAIGAFNAVRVSGAKSSAVIVLPSSLFSIAMALFCLRGLWRR
jgi:hypothetical protein